MQTDAFRGRVTRAKMALGSSWVGGLFRSPAGKLARSWLFQGMLYMEPSEAVWRLLAELVVIIGVLQFLVGADVLSTAVVVSLVHTAFWLTNSHFWALEIIPGRRLIRNNPRRVQEYLRAVRRRVTAAKCIDTCLVAGSLARDAFGPWSDLDVVFVPAKGRSARFYAHVLASRERLYAAFTRMPLELYCRDLQALLTIDAEEPRLIVKGELTDDVRGQTWMSWEAFWRTPPAFFRTSAR